MKSIENKTRPGITSLARAKATDDSPIEGTLLPASDDSVPPHVETSFERPKRIGLSIAFLVFGVFGVWACFAPIDSAAHAIGVITVRTYNQAIQHLEGGIVSEIRVQNGDMVNAGDVLLVLDSTQSLAQLDIVTGQLMSLTALESRLVAERDNLDAVVYPQLLLGAGATGRIEIDAQNGIFNARRASRDGAVAVLQQRIGQLKERIVGLKGLQASKSELAASFDDELNDVRALLAEGFADKLRLRELERSVASLQGEAAELAASISATEIQAGETELEILNHLNTFQTEVVNQLADTQNQLKDVRERANALRAIVTRTEVKAPDAGIVNGLQAHTIGGVIAPGSLIAEIVPQREDLIIEARVSPMDIDRVAIGQEATIRMSAFNAQSVPTLEGSVVNLSADSLTDEATGGEYYLARVELTPESFSDLENLTLIPGMPAEVFINSGSRTFLQYVIKPLSNSMARGLLED